VSFHHLTDHVFHELTAFRDETRSALRELRALGVAKGPARAVAHVGVELLLDVTLGQSASAQAAYLAALRAGLRPGVVASVGWAPENGRRLSGLLETLERRGVVLDTSSPVIVERIARTLSHRPLIALGDDDPPRVLEWVEAVRGRIVSSVPALAAALHAELERRLAT
jgi:hypothetical protein